jgi:hypothetical protein
MVWCWGRGYNSLYSDCCETVESKWVVGIVLVRKLSGSHFSCIVGSISQCEIASGFVETGGEDGI